MLKGTGVSDGCGIGTAAVSITEDRKLRVNTAKKLRIFGKKPNRS